MTLNDITKDKFYAAIDKKRQAANPFLKRIQEESALLQDYILQVGKNNSLYFEADPDIKLTTTNHKFTLHPNAAYQLGEKLGVNPTYIKSLAYSEEEWKRQLVAHTLNEFSKNTHRQRVLIREINGEIRGVLSDHYRRLNTSVIFESFLGAINTAGAVIVDAYTDGLTSYIETLIPELIPIQLKNSVTLVAYGLRIQNSDFGTSALDLRAFIMQAVCINGLVAKSTLRQVHLGARLPDDLQLSERTYRYDTRLTASTVVDIVNNNFRKDNIKKKLQSIQDADFVEIDQEKELKALNKANRLTKEESEAVKKIIMKNDSEDGLSGNSSLWNLSQGITAFARSVSPIRKRELEEIAGELLFK